MFHFIRKLDRKRKSTQQPIPLINDKTQKIRCLLNTSIQLIDFKDMLIIWHETHVEATNYNVFVRKQIDNINLGSSKTGYVNEKNFNKI